VYHCGAGVGALAILTNGNFYPCTSFSYAKNSGDDLVIGNVVGGINEDALLNFRNKIAIDLSDCLGCDFLKKCFYYCPADNFRVTGSMSEIPYSICELNKVVIAETDLFLADLYKTDNEIFWKKYGRRTA
jgi:radical SAM protein with 4Fe4S-binding SPASM domain